jgi:hypothetical protein
VLPSWPPSLNVASCSTDPSLRHRHSRRLAEQTVLMFSPISCVWVDWDEYFRLAAAAPRMSAPEAAERVGLAHAGNLRARTELMASHRRIVAKLTKTYARTGLSFDERIRLGKQGLVLAIQRFTLAKGLPFSTYATWWIRQSITKGLGGPDGQAGVREPRTPQTILRIRVSRSLTIPTGPVPTLGRYGLATRAAAGFGAPERHHHSAAASSSS